MKVHLVVALIHEAKPLIRRYRMVRLKGNHPYMIYTGDACMLVISGVGKIAAAGATGYLQALSSEMGSNAWLNFGIAGHECLEVGTGFVAHRVSDRATEINFYPPMIFPFSCPTSDLTTVDQAENRYGREGGYDMEASGFYKTALRTATSEWVHCYKVVSDNPRQPVEQLSKIGVTELISNRTNEIESIISMMRAEWTRYRRRVKPGRHYDKITLRWHFTDTQKRQLARLLKRWDVVFGEDTSSEIKFNTYQGPKTLLADLDRRLGTRRLVIK
ncbi:MAG: hypothetical protein ACE5GK_06025 [Nitrospiria bacterium]